MKSMGWAEMAIGLDDQERLLKRKLIKRPAKVKVQAEIERPAFECNCLIHSGAGGLKGARLKRAAEGGEQS